MWVDLIQSISKALRAKLVSLGKRDSTASAPAQKFLVYRPLMGIFYTFCTYSVIFHNGISQFLKLNLNIYFLLGPLLWLRAPTDTDSNNETIEVQRHLTQCTSRSFIYYNHISKVVLILIEYGI